MFKTVICPVCLSETNTDNEIKHLCDKCKCLINLNHKKYDYSIEGAQSIPDKKKHILRIENSKSRFKIFEKYIDKNQLFVDVGTGSGEMLIVSKKFFKNSIGFEENKSLSNYYNEKKIKVYSSKVNFELIKRFIKKDETIFCSVCHVLEHNFNPIKLLRDMINKQSKFTIYIEVPLYTGLSFKEQGVNWKLWYDQHNCLYSIETLEFLSKKIDAEILEIGFKNFISDSYSYKKNFYLFMKYPIRFLKSCFLFLFNKKNTFIDIFLRDYGYVILKIN